MTNETVMVVIHSKGCPFLMIYIFTINTFIDERSKTTYHWYLLRYGLSELMEEIVHWKRRSIISLQRAIHSM